jgi:DNA-binding HxlR family transcriptional regulator
MSEVQELLINADAPLRSTRKQKVLSVANCPNRLLLEQIADKWSVLLLAALRDTPMRFNEIKRTLEGITQKSLTQSLRRLERNGIVERRVIDTSPIAVEYEITPLGQSLKEPFQALYSWTVDYLPAVEEARKVFDARNDR